VTTQSYGPAIAGTTAIIRGGLAEADALFALLIQNKLFEQLYGGGYVFDKAALGVAQVITEQLKTSVDSVAEALGSLERALDEAVVATGE
jgi:hypothetical protein